MKNYVQDKNHNVNTMKKHAGEKEYKHYENLHIEEEPYMQKIYLLYGGKHTNRRISLFLIHAGEKPYKISHNYYESLFCHIIS